MSTYLAIIIETPQTHNSGSQQTLIVPDISTDTCFSREYTGSRGRGAAWHAMTIDSVINGNYSGDDSVVVSFAVTDKDISAIKAGIITSAGTKALTALADHTNTALPVGHGDAVAWVADSIADEDWTALTTYLATNSTYPSVMPNSAPVATQVVTPEPIVEDTKPVARIEVTERQLVAASPRMELATVPDMKWANDYLNRKVIGNHTEFDIYDQAMRDKSNVLIKGHAGSGKTMSVMAYAAARGLRFYSVSAHAGIEVSQVFGKWNPTGNAETPFAWQDGGLTDCVRNGNAVLLFNEVNFLPERFTTVIFSLLDARREITLMDKDGEVVRAADNLLIVGDMNPNYRGTRQMNQAWNDRFSQHQLTFPYDPAIEGKLIPNKALLDMANQLRARFDKEEITTPISTRSLVAFSKNMDTLGFDYAVYSYLNMFSDQERNSVSLIVETHKANILEAHTPAIRVTN